MKLTAKEYATIIINKTKEAKELSYFTVADEMCRLLNEIKESKDFEAKENFLGEVCVEMFNHFNKQL